MQERSPIRQRALVHERIPADNSGGDASHHGHWGGDGTDHLGGKDGANVAEVATAGLVRLRKEGRRMHTWSEKTSFMRLTVLCESL